MASSVNNSKKKITLTAYSKLPDKTKKLIKISCIVVVALIAIIIALAALDLFPHADGSLHVTAGKLLGTTDKDIIVNRRNNDTKKDAYFKLGSFDMPEGYVRDTGSITSSSNSLTQMFYLRPADAESPYFLFTVSGSVYDAAGAYDLLNPKEEQEEAQNVTSLVSKDYLGKTAVKGTEYTAFTISELSMVDGKYQKRAMMIAPAMNGELSIFVQVSAHQGSFKSLPTDEEMIAKAAELLDGVTIY